VESYNGFKYFVTFIDDFSRLTHLYLLKNKSEVPIIFQEFSNLVENQYDAKIKKFRFDNGTEFLNQTMSNFFKTKGNCASSYICLHTSIKWCFREEKPPSSRGD
jgi:IS30 family transposase